MMDRSELALAKPRNILPLNVISLAVGSVIVGSDCPCVLASFGRSDLIT